MSRLVYRGGSAREDNLTPRPGKDTEPKAGRAPGLSTFTSLEQAVLPGEKAQVIDLDLLGPPLAGLFDPPGGEGAVPGHVSIAPVGPNGEVDSVLLEEWAATRNTGRAHELTRRILDALVETVKRPR